MLAAIAMMGAAATANAAPADIGAAVRAAIAGDGCAASDPDAIAVCARRRGESRYRLPTARDAGFDPLGTTDSVLRERRRLIDSDGAAPDLTRGSCSATGASGITGCMIRSWREADQQRGR